MNRVQKPWRIPNSKQDPLQEILLQPWDPKDTELHSRSRRGILSRISITSPNSHLNLLSLQRARLKVPTIDALQLHKGGAALGAGPARPHSREEIQRQKRRLVSSFSILAVLPA